MGPLQMTMVTSTPIPFCGSKRFLSLATMQILEFGEYKSGSIYLSCQRKGWNFTANCLPTYTSRLMAWCAMVFQGYGKSLNNNNNVHFGPAIQGLIEEKMRNCLSPMFKELIYCIVNGSGLGGTPTIMKGVGALTLNAMPLNSQRLDLRNNRDMMDEKWRKQHILELEVYSKRLELVQDQIKLTLEELRSMGA